MVDRLGIPDEEFHGFDEAPMTKQEVRVVTLAKARINNTDVIYDVGAGCGSITVEAAMMAREGRIIAIEKNSERIEFLRSNLTKFNIHNVEVVEGEAPEVLSDLPLADRILIGGTGGKMKSIIKKCTERLRQNGKIVINTVTLESLSDAIMTLDALDLEFNVVQIAVSRGVLVDGKRIIKGLNPVYIIDAGL